ncbi:MAG: AMP-binding protein [Acidimicrobiales bacterium]
MSNWNYADIWEMCAEIRGEDSTALVHGEQAVSWAAFDRRAAGVATALLGAGLLPGAKVAQYLYNCNEYLEAVFAALKVSMVPVNTNYRYAEGELAYLFDNSDTEAIVFHGCFTGTLAGLRSRLPGVRLWLHVDDGTDPCPSWAVEYEKAVAALPASAGTHVQAGGGRSGDDLYFLYTGGTTGLPKGVMWRQDDLFALLNAGSPMPVDDDGGLEGLRPMVAAMQASPPVLLPACPLMHGTGGFTALTCLATGGKVVTLEHRGLDAGELLDTISREKVNLVTIVGDAFARPILAAIDAEPGRYDLSSLLGIISSGAMWSEETKQDLLAHNANMLLIDVFSSSEAIGMGQSVSAGGGAAHTASFKLGERARVIDDDGNEIAPGSGRSGRLALGGRLPVGYYKDAEKTARTFVTLDGKRYSVPGDYVTVQDDGSLHLLGRGSVCINTGGEKVYPEEVEEVIKTHAAVGDAACVGLPDERFGQAICALVELLPGEQATAAGIVEWVKARLSSFKAPRHVIFVESAGRTPSGKLDYAALRERAEAALVAAG